MPIIVDSIKLVAIYNANGGSGAPGQHAVTDQYTGGTQSLTLKLSSTTPTRSGYAFSSWNTLSNGTGTDYSPGQNVTRSFGSPGTYTLHLYAQWDYTVTYNANGGSGAPGRQTKEHNVTLKLSSTKPTRTGYTFVGWNTKSDGSGTTYQPGGNYTTNASVTLYAQWTVTPITPTVGTSYTVGYEVPITLSNPGGISGLTCKISYSFQGVSETISNSSSVSTSGSTVSWTPPDSLNYKFPHNSRYASCTISCTTYKSGSSLGTKTATFNLYASSGVHPVVNSFSVTPVQPSNTTPYGTSLNSYFSDKFIKNVSKVKMDYSVSVSEYDTPPKESAYKATIKNLTASLSNNSLDYTITPSPSGQSTVTGSKTSGVLSKSGGRETCTLTVYDTRGRSGSAEQTPWVYAYNSPVLSNVTAERNSSNESRIDIKFSSTITNINSANKNSKKYKVEYKTASASSYNSTPAISLRDISSYSGTTSVTTPTNISFDFATVYNIRVTIYDEFNSQSIVLTVGISDSIIFDVTPSTKTISFHKTDPGDGKDHWYDTPVVFHNDVYVNGHTTKIGYKANSDKTTTTSVSSGTFTAVTNITLSAGTWIITGRIRFPANANGRRGGNISTTSADASIHVQVPAVSGAATQLAFTKIVSITSSTKYYLNAYQDSGSTLTLPAGTSGTGEINALVAVRIA